MLRWLTGKPDVTPDGEELGEDATELGEDTPGLGEVAGVGTASGESDGVADVLKSVDWIAGEFGSIGNKIGDVVTRLEAGRDIIASAGACTGVDLDGDDAFAIATIIDGAVSRLNEHIEEIGMATGREESA